MRSANLTREETAARSASITLDTVEIELDLTGAIDPGREGFPTRSVLRFAATAAETWLDFLGESVDEVVVNGLTQPVQWDGARIRLTGLAAQNTVTVRATGRYSRSGEGLHRFTDPVDGAVYLYTQYEPADARRVYPVFEQPDMKARWSFAVSAPEGWQILSGGAETSRAKVDGGLRVTFATTPPLSSYLTAVAAGPYHRVDGVWEGPDGDVALGALCRASLAEYFEAEEILAVTRAGLTLFTESFVQPYPWGKYDQIFVPEYNLGAMENPGLVTFTEAYVFRGAATAAQREARTNTILHEMAHMWFGDLVTMRWWDDLWLKESFADFMGTYAAAEVGGHPDAWVTFANRRKAWAYQQDQLPTTHPIVADIPDLEAAKLNFDGITYAKGASVLKQLVAFVGPESFFRGAQRYFATHAYGNTTLEDLLVALEGASGRDLRAWSATWLETTGMSRIAVERGDGVRIVQDPPRPHRLSLGMYALSGTRLEQRASVELDLVEAVTDVDAPVLPEADLLLPNDGDQTYAKVVLDERSVQAVAVGLSSIASPLARAVVWSALWNATRDGELPVTRYLDIVQTHVAAETSVAVVADVAAHAGAAIAEYARDADRSVLRARWLETAWQALEAAPAGSDHQLAWARAVASAAAVCADRAEEIRSMLDGDRPAPVGLALDPDLRWSLLFALTATGESSVAAADAEQARDDTAKGRASYLAVLAARPEASVRAEAWERAWTDHSLSNDHLDAVISGARAGGRRDLVADFDADYFARILPAWSERSIEIARRLVRGLFPRGDDLTLVDQWLAAHPEAPGALRRLLWEERDQLARALRVRAAQPGV